MGVKAATRAEAMGRRAGADFRDLGIPTRCPFTVDALQRAWARGYTATPQGRKISRRGRSSSTPRQENLQP